jgi:hypothetical protein
MARAEVIIEMNDGTGMDKFKKGDKGLIDGYVFNQETGDVEAIVIVGGKFVNLPIWVLLLNDLEE